MFDARDLLGQLLQSQAGRSAGSRLEHAMGPRGLGGGGNPLSDMLGGLLGGAGGGAAGGDILGGLARQADSFFGSGTGDALRTTVQDPNQLKMGGLAALAASVLGGRSAGMGGAVGAGLLALLGSLAFSTMKQRQAGAGSAAPTPQQDVPLGLREPETPDEQAQVQDTALLAIRSMINAAKADGAIDGSEMGRIMGKLKELGTDGEARDFVMNELQKPLDLNDLLQGARTPEQAVQIYGASLLAIEVDTDVERDYLARLAQGLKLDAETVKHIHEAFGVSAPS